MVEESDLRCAVGEVEGVEFGGQCEIDAAPDGVETANEVSALEHARGSAVAARESWNLLAGIGIGAGAGLPVRGRVAGQLGGQTG